MWKLLAEAWGSNDGDEEAYGRDAVYFEHDGIRWSPPAAATSGSDFYNDFMRMLIAVCALVLAFARPAAPQTPQPFPRPGSSTRPAPPPAPAPAVAAPAPRVDAAAAAPDAVTVWFPVYPTAQFIASYDAGHGQRYYIYGATASFADLVTYYRAQLKEKGDLVFEQPPTHMFEIGRFRQETMAFPPGVTVKDWTWGGSAGYPNPRRGVEPARFPTIIMIVPPPAGAAAPQR